MPGEQTIHERAEHLRSILTPVPTYARIAKAVELAALSNPDAAGPLAERLLAAALNVDEAAERVRELEVAGMQAAKLMASSGDGGPATRKAIRDLQAAQEERRKLLEETLEAYPEMRRHMQPYP